MTAPSVATARRTGPGCLRERPSSSARARYEVRRTGLALAKVTSLSIMQVGVKHTAMQPQACHIVIPPAPTSKSGVPVKTVAFEVLEEKEPRSRSLRGENVIIGRAYRVNILTAGGPVQAEAVSWGPTELRELACGRMYVVHGARIKNGTLHIAQNLCFPDVVTLLSQTRNTVRRCRFSRASSSSLQTVQPSSARSGRAAAPRRTSGQVLSVHRSPACSTLRPRTRFASRSARTIRRCERYVIST